MKWLAVAVLVTVLAGCGGDTSENSDGGPDAGKSPSATGSTERPSASAAEDTFVRLTAEHLCAVQGSVFADPKELAAAYERAPDYPELSADQVTELEERVVEDPEFSADLVDALADTCG